MVQNKLDFIEKAGIIVRSIPLVVVHKSLQPGKPPRRRPCVDYWLLNSLLPTITKVHSKTKNVLNLVPLPKLDEVYARLNSSCKYSTFDVRNRYQHIELSRDSQSKSTFVPPMGKFEFTHMTFRLIQAPVYFQKGTNRITLSFQISR